MSLTVTAPPTLNPGLNVIIFDTGPTTDASQRYEVANPYPHDIYIRKVRRWMGTSYGSVLDINHNLWVHNPHPYLVVDGPWDRYGDPNLPHTEDINFAPDYILLVAGGWFSFNVSCGALIGPSIPVFVPHSHHHAVYIYFLRTLPQTTITWE